MWSPIVVCMMYYIMHRTQILLESWQYEKLKAAAEREGTSISMLVRQAVSRFFDKQPRRTTDRLAEITGIGDDPAASGPNHDAVIYGPRRKRS